MVDNQCAEMVEIKYLLENGRIKIFVGKWQKLIVGKWQNLEFCWKMVEFRNLLENGRNLIFVGKQQKITNQTLIIFLNYYSLNINNMINNCCIINAFEINILELVF